MYACMYVCMYARMTLYACMYACMHVCMYVCMHVRMYAYIQCHTYIIIIVVMAGEPQVSFLRAKQSHYYILTYLHLCMAQGGEPEWCLAY